MAYQLTIFHLGIYLKRKRCGTLQFLTDNTGKFSLRKFATPAVYHTRRISGDTPFIGIFITSRLHQTHHVWHGAFCHSK